MPGACRRTFNGGVASDGNGLIQVTESPAGGTGARENPAAGLKSCFRPSRSAIPPLAAGWGAYARAVAAGLLALIAFCSLLLTPFTEQYAREQVPQQFWSSPRGSGTSTGG